MRMISHGMWPLPACLPSAERRFPGPDADFAANHFNLAISYKNVAHIADAEDNVLEAVTLRRRAYAVSLKALGSDQPRTKADAAMPRRYEPVEP